MTARIQLVPARPRRGEIVEVRVLIQHNMETGYRRDEEGRGIRRNCINLFICRYNGVEVFRAEFFPAVSANPFVSFTTVATESGTITMTWKGDNGFFATESVAIAVE